ncbi:alanine racemase [Atopomonas sediminilitoris]|uniref:alanine racemase n=1 Tax=Atopomonas sediminilitoris TaxID=2919919 RepID=UPI001F4E01A4|nr:alanine racemase [Atopomonas sediminilitoris]MCJ8170223.1 alanine racemase [Atopomonas sediminilitoris]
MRPTQAHIDLTALAHNVALAQRCAPGKQLFAVVKANAYGHGVEPVVCALPMVDGFAVCSLEEAAPVRALAQAEQRVLLLEGVFSADEYAQAAQWRLDVVVHSAQQVAWLLAAELQAPLNVWLKLDSSMHRLGLSPDELAEVYPALRAATQVAELNLLSHLACADERGHPLNEVQLEAFLDQLPERNFDQLSLANSAALLTLPAWHMDWLRPGLMLYGASPCVGLTARELGLKPVMSLRSQVLALRDVPAGDSVGYAASWVATSQARIATVACGYADGYPRHAPAGTPVVINGQRAPLVGRVSMDLITVDVTALADVAVGDAVELWGAQLPVDEVAAAAGTISYELLSKVTARVPRRY